MSKMKRMLKENWGFLTILLLMFSMRGSVLDWYHVPTGSMLPSIVEGDRILVNKMAYRLYVPFTDIALAKTGVPSRGDVVVFHSEAANERMVKRVVGMPGDRISMVNNTLYINGEAVFQSELDQAGVGQSRLGEVEHLIRIKGRSPASSFPDVVVPTGQIFVLGDNRNNSMDSRYYGSLPIDDVQGRAFGVFFSLDNEAYYLPRLARFFSDLN